ncbi:MAG TPA: hypothetical protein H9898_08700 [Candidatus Anaerobiospirillum stercoravium]|nr:hypothetical protein [Candidatus Anaerobiospirillum stercoravium]
MPKLYYAGAPTVHAAAGPSTRVPINLSGNRRILLIAAYLASGRKVEATAERFGVTPQVVTTLLAEVEAQGLVPWCQQQRILDYSSSQAQALRAQEQNDSIAQSLGRNPDLATIDAFRLAMGAALSVYQLDPTSVANLFDLPPTVVFNLQRKVRAQGFESWSQDFSRADLDLVQPHKKMLSTLVPQPPKPSAPKGERLSLKPNAKFTRPNAGAFNGNTIAAAATPTSPLAMSGQASGERRIFITLTALSGAQTAQTLAARFKVAVSDIEAWVAAARQQGLLEWCQAQRKLDEEPQMVLLLARERMQAQPKFDARTFALMQVTAVKAVLSQGLTQAKVIKIFGLADSALDKWVAQAQERGLAAWSAQITAAANQAVAAAEPEPPTASAPKTPRVFTAAPTVEPESESEPEPESESEPEPESASESDQTESGLTGADCIRVLAAYLSQQYSVPELTAASGLSAADLKRFKREVKEQGLIAWCLAQHKRDQDSTRPSAFKLQVDCNHLDLFIETAVEGVRSQHFTAEQVAAILLLDAAEVAAWVDLYQQEDTTMSQPQPETPAPQDQSSDLAAKLAQLYPYLTAPAHDAPGAHQRSRITGATRVALAAAFLSGKFNRGELLQASASDDFPAYVFENTRRDLRRNLQEGSLLPWLIQQHSSDQRAGFGHQPKLKEQFLIDRAALPEFRVAAVEGVLEHQLPYEQVAALCGVRPDEVASWVKDAQAQGFKAWRQAQCQLYHSFEQQQELPREATAGLLKISGRRRIDLLAAWLSGGFTQSDLAQAAGTSLGPIKNMISSIKEKGLYEWCQIQRLIDQHHSGAARILSAEQQHPLEPVMMIDRATLPQFKEAALDAVRHHGATVEEAGQVLGLEPKQIQAWLADAEVEPQANTGAESAAAASVVTLPDELSGAQRINLLIELLLCEQAAVSYEGVCRTYQLSADVAAALLRAVEAEGLFNWCEAQRQRDENQPLKMQVTVHDGGVVDAFKVAAVEAVLKHGRSVATVAQILSLKRSELAVWSSSAMVQSFDQWVQNFSARSRALALGYQGAGHAAQPQAKLQAEVASATAPKPQIVSAAAPAGAQAQGKQTQLNNANRYSGNRRIAIVAAVLAGVQMAQIARACPISNPSISRFVKNAREKGLFAWCQQQRLSDLTKADCAELLAQEAQQHCSLLELDYHEIPEFKQAALQAVQQGHDPKEVASVLGLDLERLQAWLNPAAAPTAQATSGAKPEAQPDTKPAATPAQGAASAVAADPAVTPSAVSSAEVSADLSGERCIRIVGAYLSAQFTGAQIAAHYQVSEEQVLSLVREAQQEGLVAWAQAQRKRDESSEAAQRRAESDRLKPGLDLDYGSIEPFRLASILAVQHLDLSPIEVAGLFNLRLSQVITWVSQFQAQSKS